MQTGYDKLTAGRRTNAIWKENDDLWARMKKAVDAKGEVFVIVSHVK